MNIAWVRHPSYLPRVPSQPFVVVDVAFAAAEKYYSVTAPFLDEASERLACWVDHHEHAEAWPRFVDDDRFVLATNRQAAACPELIDTELVERISTKHGRINTIIAHADFDGALSAAKWWLGGREPWDGADEDARGVDSPGRGYTVSEKARRLSRAIDAIVVRKDRHWQGHLQKVVRSIIDGEESIGLQEDLDTLAESSRRVEDEAVRLADQKGRSNGRGVFVVELEKPVDKRMRRWLLLAAEAKEPIGVVVEPAGRMLSISAATINDEIDLAEAKSFHGGRSDYRFAKVTPQQLAGLLVELEALLVERSISKGEMS